MCFEFWKVLCLENVIFFNNVILFQPISGKYIPSAFPFGVLYNYQGKTFIQNIWKFSGH